jgi:hypothetical protein
MVTVISVHDTIKTNNADIKRNRCNSVVFPLTKNKDVLLLVCAVLPWIRLL